MKAPDNIYVREYPDGSFNPTWETKRKDDPTTVLHEYIRKDLVEHIIRGALGPQDALNKIRSL